MDNNNKLVNIKTIRRRRSECSWKRSSSTSSPTLSSLKHQYNNHLDSLSLSSSNSTTHNIPPTGPIHIVPSWNPINRADKPPYSYATIIGHAILTSKDRRLTLNDIYVWITENYPFYSNETQGWQNSIRHNLSLHKAFVKIDRDSSSIQNPPRKGCFWTIRAGKEKSFIDNLQKPVGSSSSSTSFIRKQYSLSNLSSISKRQQQLRRSSLLDIASININSNNNNSSTSSIGERGGGGPPFNTFRTTIHTTGVVPESEPIVTTTNSSSDSYCNTQSPTITESSNNTTTSSSLYQQQQHELLVPDESTTTYQVYPDEQHEIFGSNCSVADSYTYSTHSGASSSYYQPYSSTSSSSYADYHHHSGAGPHNITTKSNSFLYNKATAYNNYSPYSNNNMMDWTNASTTTTTITTSQGPSLPLPLKHDHLLYGSTNNSNNSASLPSYYYLQQPPSHYQQQARPLGSSSDFSSSSSFLHR